MWVRPIHTRAGAEGPAEIVHIGLRHFREFVGEKKSVRKALTGETVQSFNAHRLDEGKAKQTVNNDLSAVSILVTYAIKRGWIEERPEIKRFGDGDNRAMIEDSKTSSGVRTVFVPEWAAEAVLDHVEEHDLSGTDPVFFIRRRKVQEEHNRATEMAGIPDYTIHDHRHTAAVHLARAGMPLHLLQQQLGHKDIKMTMKYPRFHPDYNDVAGYFDRVGDRLGLGGGGNEVETLTNNETNNDGQGRTPRTDSGR